MSPIKGVSEIIRLPRLGKIRLGTKTENGEGCTCLLPADHFICPDEVKKVFGEKPRELPIMFPTENSEQWASQYFRLYSASGKLVCRGDGETALVMIGHENEAGRGLGDLEEIECDPRMCHYYRAGDCRRVMNLQFLLPDCPGFGVYQLDTGSYHSMLNINSMLELTRNICGRVSLIPLSLQLVEQEIEPEDFPNTVHVLNLACRYSLAEMQRIAQGPPAQALLLPPPDSEAPEDLIIQPAPVPSGASEQDELLDLWAKAKRKICNYEVQSHQITRWFATNYWIEADLIDFDLPRPPAKFSADQLKRFCEFIDLYTSRI
jgi:hypothetical protein